MYLLDGKKEAETIQKRLAKQVRSNSQPHPFLAIILIGNNPASTTYVRIKQRFAAAIGIPTRLYHLTTEQSTTTSLIKLITRLNTDTRICGILLQLPLPSKFSTQKAIAAIIPKKDVDGLHGSHALVTSPVVAAVRHLLLLALKQHVPTKRHRGALIVKNSIFGMNLMRTLTNMHIPFSLITISDVQDLQYTRLRQYSIIVSTLGFPHAILSKYIRKDAILIDVGFTKTPQGIKGDFHPACARNAACFSPVPGGIGPLTVAYVFKNLFLLHKNVHGKIRTTQSQSARK